MINTFLQTLLHLRKELIRRLQLPHTIIYYDTTTIA